LRLRAGIRGYIETELEDYYCNKRELEELKEDIAVGLPAFDDVGIRTQTNKISKPTEAKTLDILTNRRIKRIEQTLKAIEIVLRGLDKNRLKLVELKYWQKPRRFTDEGIAIELHVNPRTIYKWTHSICYAIAKELGLAN